MAAPLPSWHLSVLQVSTRFFSAHLPAKFLLPVKAIRLLIIFILFGGRIIFASPVITIKNSVVYFPTHFYSALFELCGRIFG
jgi:hypothetical protein